MHAMVAVLLVVPVKAVVAPLANVTDGQLTAEEGEGDMCEYILYTCAGKTQVINHKQPVNHNNTQ